LAYLVLAAAAAPSAIVACGARSGLPFDGPPTSDATAPVDTGIDAGSESDVVDAGDAYVDGPNVPTPYCLPTDLQHVYFDGGPIATCTYLEECEQVPAGDAATARCINPCRDTLGSNTSNGCEFFAMEIDTPDPTTVSDVAGGCYAVFVVNQWQSGARARIEVSWKGSVLDLSPFARTPRGAGSSITYAPYDVDAGLATNDVAILFLSRDLDAGSDPSKNSPRALASCPPGVTPAVGYDTAIHGNGIGSAFRIAANVPVVAYQMYPYGAGRARATSATLLLPTTVWGTNYLLANAYSPSTIVSDGTAKPTLAILAEQDDTQVTIDPVRDIVADGGIPGTEAGTPVSYKIQRGQYLQISQLGELSGSTLESSAPVGVVGGATLLSVPADRLRSDTAQQMLPPVGALGSRYVAVRYRNRRNRGEETVPWRLVGAVDGTLLTYDPPQLGAPATIGRGQVAEFSAPGPFVVSSQGADHPFYMAQYMTGGAWAPPLDGGGINPLDGEGDPEFVNVVPPDQYLSRYVFFTDPTYPETNLVVVRAKNVAINAFPTVSLDCLGEVSGWAPVDSQDLFEYARVDLSTGNFEPQGSCNNGVHTMTGQFGVATASPPAFGVTIWGWGNTITYPMDNGGTDEANPAFTRWVSYAYPAGANFQQLNAIRLSAK
jgi:hypothetical protein